MFYGVRDERLRAALGLLGSPRRGAQEMCHLSDTSVPTAATNRTHATLPLYPITLYRRSTAPDGSADGNGRTQTDTPFVDAV